MTEDKVTLMFAGPNGSGKSSAKSFALEGFQGEYINADDIAASLRDKIPDYVERNVLAANMAETQRLECMKSGKSFAFETVMSTPEKVAILSQARELGFEINMVFVSTSDPSINISRVAARVLDGGHSVPEDKIRSRYTDAMALLPSAIEQTDNAYIFDNSAPYQAALLVAQKNGRGAALEVLALDYVPDWAGVVLKNQMDERTRSHAALAHDLQALKISGKTLVAAADASNGCAYRGEIVSCTPHHALQRVEEKKFLIHDLALSQQKRLDKGVQTVSYAYDKGKVVPIDKNLSR